MLCPTHFISGPLLYFYLSDNGAICDHLTREQSALARHHSSTDIHTISAEKHTEREREREREIEIEREREREMFSGIHPSCKRIDCDVTAPILM